MHSSTLTVSALLSCFERPEQSQIASTVSQNTVERNSLCYRHQNTPQPCFTAIPVKIVALSENIFAVSKVKS